MNNTNSHMNQNLAFLTAKNKITEYMKEKGFLSLAEFIKENPDLKTFQEKTKLNNSIRRVWGLNVTEEDYQQVLDVLQQEFDEKLRIETERLSTVNVNGKTITSYDGEKGKTIVDDSYSDKPMEEQLVELRERYSKRFGVQDVEQATNNTEEMMDFMREEIKLEPEFNAVADITKESLSGKAKELAEVAEAYQDTTDNVVHVDFERGLIMDEDQILSIEEREDGYGVFSPEEIEPNEKKLAPQKTLTKKKGPSKQAGFSSAVALALLSGLFMGLAFLNVYLKIK